MVLPLKSVQNAAAKLITRSHKHDHVTSLLIELHLLPVCQQILFKIFILTYKAFHGLSPPYSTATYPAESIMLLHQVLP